MTEILAAPTLSDFAPARPVVTLLPRVQAFARGLASAVGAALVLALKVAATVAVIWFGGIALVEVGAQVADVTLWMFDATLDYMSALSTGFVPFR